MEKACAHCPFRVDVRPFLHPERAAEIAYSAHNRYSDFPCHKTVDYDNDSDEGEGTTVHLYSLLTRYLNEHLPASNAPAEVPE